MLIDKNEIWKTVISLPGFEASSNGRIRLLSNGEYSERKQYLNKQHGYLYCSIPTSVKNAAKIKRNMIHVHQLVAEAFFGIPDKTIKKVQVNHKDGVKINNNVINLEWVTPKENIDHAYKSNLHSTNTVQEFISLQSLAKFFGTNKQKINYLIYYYSNKNKNYYLGDYTFELSKNNRSDLTKLMRKAVLVYDASTKNIEMYDSISDSSRHTGVTSESIRSSIKFDSMINGLVFRLANTGNDIFYIFNDEDIKNSILSYKHHSSKTMGSKRTNIFVKNFITGTINKYESIGKCVKELNIDNNKIRNLAYDNNKVLHNGMIFGLCYEDICNKVFDSTDVEKSIYKINYAITIKNYVTNNIIDINGIVNARNIAKIDFNQVRKMLYSNEFIIYKGQILRFKKFDIIWPNVSLEDINLSFKHPILLI